MISLYAISGLINFVTSALLGWLVFAQSKKKEYTKIVFSLFSLAVAFWSLGYFIWQVSETPGSALFWIKFLMAGAIFIPIFYLHFVINFLKLPNKKFLLLSGYFLGFLFLVLDLFGKYFISGIEPKLGFKFWPVPGTIFHFFLFIFFLYVAYSTFLLLKKLKSTTGTWRNQILVTLIGMTVGFAGGSTNYFLWYDIPVPPVGNFLILVFIISIAYAIVRYRFLDVRIIVRKSTIHVIEALFLFLSFHLAVWIKQAAFGTLYSREALTLGALIALLIVYIYAKFDLWIKKIANQWFFGELFAHEETLRNLSHRLTTMMDLNELVEVILRTIEKTMNTQRTAIVLRHGDEFVLEKSLGTGFDKSILKFKENRLTAYLARTKLALVYDELTLLINNLRGGQEGQEQDRRGELELVAKDMKTIKAELCLPLILHDQIRGLIVTGGKVSKSAFTKEDIDLLETLASQASFAIENARLYFDMEQEVKERTLELRQINRRLEDLLEIKSEFLDIASHQLRTPTSIIRGMLSMVIDGSAGKRREEFIHDSFEASERLTTIINDLLEATEMEGKELSVSLKKTSLFDLLLKSINFFQEPAEGKGLELIFKPAPNLRASPLIRLDRERFRSAIDNLIDNAVKYTLQGSVTISALQTAAKATITISDTGIGLSQADIGKLFQKFTRGETASRMVPNGSGLGLFIVRKIIEAHGGKVEVESPGQGKGTTFTISLPIERG